MKNKILIVAVLAFLAGAVLTGCNSSSDKLEKAKVDSKEANKNLAVANAAYLADVENYKTETQKRIERDNQSIVEFNSKIKDDQKEIKESYQKELGELEQKYANMQKRMDEYQAAGKEDWEKFKAEFDHDMDQLGQSLKDLTTNNIK